MKIRSLFGLSEEGNDLHNANLHHAYLVLGDKSTARATLKNLLEKELGFKLDGNPDVREFDADTYTIDESRALKSAHYMKSLSGRSVFIVSFNSITFEAQQSLLKVFEDPVRGVHFFIIAPTIHNFLPTLLSRFFVVKISAEVENTREKAIDFISRTPAKRMDITAKLIEDKNKAAAIELLNEIESILPVDPTNAKSLHDVMDMRSFLRSRSPSLKIILDHLALTLPVVAKKEIAK